MTSFEAATTLVRNLEESDLKEAIRIDTTVKKDGSIVVPGIHAGQEVEVIVLLKQSPAKSYPLRRTRGVYKSPFEPAIPPSDWEHAS